MEDLKKLTEAFGNNDIPTISFRIKQANKKVKKLDSIVKQLEDSEIQNQFIDKKKELFDSIKYFFLKNSNEEISLANTKNLR